MTSVDAASGASRSPGSASGVSAPGSRMVSAFSASPSASEGRLLSLGERVRQGLDGLLERHREQHRIDREAEQDGHERRTGRDRPATTTQTALRSRATSTGSSGAIVRGRPRCRDYVTPSRRSAALDRGTKRRRVREHETAVITEPARRPSSPCRSVGPQRNHPNRCRGTASPSRRLRPPADQAPGRRSRRRGSTPMRTATRSR